ncbi:MAG: glyceraldehyde 3-phosphate dehydrogenase NAD-binding domain-containing protein [Thermoanaerobaculia bacterium]
MSLRFGINGLGRIGRALVRIAATRPELGLELVAANDSADPRQLARLLRHDTVHHTFPVEVASQEGSLLLAGRPVPLSQASAPAEIDWSAAGVEVVLEATGKFRRRADAAGHLGRGRSPVRQVVVSATMPDADLTLCLGINDRDLDPSRQQVLSNASCTTNCLAPLLLVLDRTFGVEHALMNTVHCVTNSQNLVDMAHPDPRRARSALANIIPTTSDAISSIAQVMPEMEGKVEGLAMRVPVVAGSLVDLTVRLGRPASRDGVADAFRSAEAGALAGILGTTDEELVSSDVIGDPRSAVVDLPLLQIAGDRLLRVVAWYDNEWGYSNRLAELLARLAVRSAH